MVTKVKLVTTRSCTLKVNLSLALIWMNSWSQQLWTILASPARSKEPSPVLLQFMALEKTLFIYLFIFDLKLYRRERSLAICYNCFWGIVLYSGSNMKPAPLVSVLGKKNCRPAGHEKAELPLGSNTQFVKIRPSDSG